MTAVPERVAPSIDTRTEPVIEVRDLTMRFASKRSETVALDDVSLTVRAGELVTIVGPSGCGKSTLLKIVAGLTAYTEGEVRLNGQVVTRPQRDIGFAFQRSALLEWRGVRKNILLQAEMRGMDRRRAQERADALIELTGLTGFERRCRTSSPVACSSASPCAGRSCTSRGCCSWTSPSARSTLTREQMNIEMNRIWRETGTTIVLVTHSVPEAVFLGSRIVVMSRRPGRIVETLEPGLPAERDYGATLVDPRFTGAAERLRDLLGASHVVE